MRITHDPAPDRLLEWYPDGNHLLFASTLESGSQRFNQLYKVSKNGGLPAKLPVPYGEFGAVSPDGKLLAYKALGPGFRYRPCWSPDGKKITFVDQTMNIQVYAREAKQVKKVAPAEVFRAATVREWYGFTMPRCRTACSCARL